MYMIRQAKTTTPAASNMVGQLNMPIMFLLVFIALSATLLFEVTELAIAVIGAGLYQLYRISLNKAPKPLKSVKVESEENGFSKPRVTQEQRAERTPQKPRTAPRQEQDWRQTSVMPVMAPTFKSTGFDAEVEELIAQILPTAEADAVVQRLVQVVKKSLAPLIHEVEITGFASGNPLASKAFGVAVPEVDIVISASPVTLARALQSRLTHGGAAAIRNDPRKLQKSAIRACTDELVAVGGLKFRRSAFRGEDPKVTLLAPASITGTASAISLDISVNSATPLHSAALLTECGRLEPRAKELVLLVKRWARDRGIAHAAKGHLSPYAWSLLSIYFLQVRAKLLPALKGFEMSSCLTSSKRSEEKWSRPDTADANITAAALFKQFIDFYHIEFDWRNEAVSVRLAVRAKPALMLPIHIVESAGSNKTEVAPSIEDPFDMKRNIAISMNAQGVSRLREELLRAKEFFIRTGSLAELLEPWVPPEREASCAAGQPHVGSVDGDRSP